MSNIALLGAGRIGQVHARAIARTPGANLVAVADTFAEVAKNLAHEYGAEVHSIDAIESMAGVDAVVICTPTDTHADPQLTDPRLEVKTSGLTQETNRFKFGTSSRN